MAPQVAGSLQESTQPHFSDYADSISLASSSLLLPKEGLWRSEKDIALRAVLEIRRDVLFQCCYSDAGPSLPEIPPSKTLTW